MFPNVIFWTCIVSQKQLNYQVFNTVLQCSDKCLDLVTSLWSAAVVYTLVIALQNHIEDLPVTVFYHASFVSKDINETNVGIYSSLYVCNVCMYMHAGSLPEKNTPRKTTDTLDWRYQAMDNIAELQSVFSSQRTEARGEPWCPCQWPPTLSHEDGPRQSNMYVLFSHVVGLFRQHWYYDFQVLVKWQELAGQQQRWVLINSLMSNIDKHSVNNVKQPSCGSSYRLLSIIVVVTIIFVACKEWRWGCNF